MIRSDRKTLAIQIRDEETVIVRAPRRAAKRDIDRILQEKDGWIKKHLAEFKEKKLKAGAHSPKSQEEIAELTKRAAEYIPGRVSYFAGLIGVDYGRVTIRRQKTRWGSCSSKGNLNFNCLLMLAPGEVLDYVVVHELCHRKEMNHSRAFWREVERVLPDYRKQVKWLKENGSGLY